MSFPPQGHNAVTMLFPNYTPFDIPISTDQPAAPRVTIHGIRSVESDGPALLLLHGFPQTLAIWHKVAQKLREKYTVIALDIRGYGQSSKPLNPNASDHSLYAKSAMAADCAAVMSRLGFSRYYVVGHDRGARVAHKLCVDYPDRVAKCMFLDIAPTKAMQEATDREFATGYWHWFFLIQPSPFPERMILANPREFARRQITGMYAGRDTFHDEAFGQYEAALADESTVFANCEDYRAAAKEDIKEATDDAAAGRWIKCPVRVLWGKYGMIQRKFDAINEWKKVSENGCVDESRSEALECGHYIPEERPEELLEHILEFCKGDEIDKSGGIAPKPEGESSL